MTVDKIAFKNKLKQIGLSVIEQRIARVKAVIDNVQQWTNSEEKSSAGDKYETGRAMGHLEKEMQLKQLAEYQKELAAIYEVDTSKVFNSVTTGAFIECGAHSFFIALGLGKQVVDNKAVFFLSPQAPLYKLLQNKKAGDQFHFNGVELTIQDVY